MELAAGSHPGERLVHQLLVKGEGVVERDVAVADQRKPACVEVKALCAGRLPDLHNQNLRVRLALPHVQVRKCKHRLINARQPARANVRICQHRSMSAPAGQPRPPTFH